MEPSAAVPPPLPAVADQGLVAIAQTPDKPAKMPRMLDGFKINMSHQEMDRLVEELDNLWKAFTMSDDGERASG